MAAVRRTGTDRTSHRRRHWGAGASTGSPDGGYQGRTQDPHGGRRTTRGRVRGGQFVAAPVLVPLPPPHTYHPVKKRPEGEHQTEGGPVRVAWPCGTPNPHVSAAGGLNTRNLVAADLEIESEILATKILKILHPKPKHAFEELGVNPRPVNKSGCRWGPPVGIGVAPLALGRDVHRSGIRTLETRVSRSPAEGVPMWGAGGHGHGGGNPQASLQDAAFATAAGCYSPHRLHQGCFSFANKPKKSKSDLGGRNHGGKMSSVPPCLLNAWA